MVSGNTLPMGQLGGYVLKKEQIITVSELFLQNIQGRDFPYPFV